MIRWIFIDVGNVLFNDDPQSYYIHRRYYEEAARRAPGFSFEQFLRDREAEVGLGNRWPTQTVLLRYLSPSELDTVYRRVTDELRGIYDSMNLPMPGVHELVRELAGGYRLGIIANQVVECRTSLARRGLLDHFQVVAISEELGLHKPDPAVFRWALDRAGVSPDEAVMVGDRHDNDIVPAAELGLPTVWVRWRSWIDKGWHPDDPLVRAYLESHDREPFYGRETRPDVEATRTASDLAAVVAAIGELNGQPRASRRRN